VIWVAGARGLVGGETCALLRERGLAHEGTGREVDVASEAAVSAFADRVRPTWILNAAGFTDVDAAEAREAEARAANADGARHLARAARRVGARLVHLSTDYVFDGAKGAPYMEDDRRNPLSVYGRSKADGEAAVREECASHYVVRTSWVHGPSPRGFVATVLGRLRGGAEVRMVADQTGSPTYARDLAEALLALVSRDERAFGTYHYANAGTCTRFDLARAVRAGAVERGLLPASAPDVVPVSTLERAAPARRPAYSALSAERFRARLGLEIPCWQDGLSRHLDRLACPR
jgi:dTDP-4-dehydrorhamnose reductase